jgi:hypothetical protein
VSNKLNVPSLLLTNAVEKSGLKKKVISEWQYKYEQQAAPIP